MKKILYIHGFNGSANGTKAQSIREALGTDYTVDAPAIPNNPDEAVKYLKGISDNYDLIIGSSLGAAYAMKCWSHIPKVLINPAMKPAEYIRKYIGIGTEFNNGIETSTVSEEYLNLLEKYTIYADEEERWVTHCIVSTTDDLFGPENAKICEKKFSIYTPIKSTHQVEESVLKETVIPIIKEWADKTEFFVPAPVLRGPYITEIE